MPLCRQQLVRCFHTSPLGAGRKQRGFTLLEVMLALGLSVLVIAMVGMSVNSTLKLVDTGRNKTQRDQLARAIMAKIVGDVRSTIRYEPFDSSGMMSVASTSKTSSSSSQSSTSSTASKTSTSKTTSSTGNSSSSGNSSSNSSSSSSSDSSSDSSTTTQTIAGVVGDTYGLIIDLGHVPRIDEYTSTDASNNSTGVPPSDVRTVTYFLAGASAPQSQVISSSNAVDGTGLVRAEMDHAMWEYANQNGQSTLDGAVIVAPEVLALEFEYFDGTEWDSSWDTTQNSGLPQAIKISMILADPSHDGQANYTPPQYASVADAIDQDPDSVYSTVVRLPASDPIQSTSSSGSQSSSSGSSSSSSGTSGSSAGGSSAAQ